MQVYNTIIWYLYILQNDHYHVSLTFITTHSYNFFVWWTLLTPTYLETSKCTSIINYTERWCCESPALNMPANLENSAVSTGLKRSVFIPVAKKGNANKCWNYPLIALISDVSKVMLKILQARLQPYVNRKLLDSSLF